MDTQPLARTLALDANQRQPRLGTLAREMRKKAVQDAAKRDAR